VPVLRTLDARGAAPERCSQLDHL